MENLTELEKKVLKVYLADQCVYDFGYGALTFMSLINQVNSNLIAEWFKNNPKKVMNDETTLTENQMKGILSSLVKKEIIECEDYESNESNAIYLNSKFRSNEALLNQYKEAVIN